ncbi:hypothetical protein [Haladaptatus sp. NG-SE-30]
MPVNPSPSILTQAQRELLRGEKETDERSERAMRARIRYRVRSAFTQDAPLLLGMSRSDLDTVFHNFEQGERSISPDEEQTEFYDGVRDLLGIIYLQTHDHAPPYDFETLLRQGVTRAIERKYENEGTTPGIKVDFDVEELSIRLPDDVLDAIERRDLERLSASEAQFALRLALSDDDVPDDVVRQQFLRRWEEARDAPWPKDDMDE